MALAHFGDPEALQVEQLAPQIADGEAEIGLEMSVDLEAEQLVNEGVQRLGVPPAVHIGLAEAERSMAEDATVEPVVMYLNVERPVTVDLDTRLFQQIGEVTLWTGIHHANPRRVANRLVPGNGCAKS